MSIKDQTKTSITKHYTRYVIQNVFGMLGLSLYVFVDTLFISKAEGADGITALNLVLPVYSLIFAIGVMIGVGSAIRFRICRARKDPQADRFFFQAFLWVLIFGAFFMLLGGFFPQLVLKIMGGTARIRAVGASYTRIFMLFAPFFMLNHVCNAFVRNDDDPGLAMAATLINSLFNIVMDYVFMFPMKMGIAGAALATGLSPIVGIAVCSLHFLRPKNTLRFVPARLSIKNLIRVCQLGVSAFVGEISAGITTAVFNFLILSISGNIGVAAYAVIANIAIICNAMFNGVSQGSQPLISAYFGTGDHKAVRKVLHLGLGTAIVLAVIMIAVINGFADPLIGAFNSERDPMLVTYAEAGIPIYFTGYLFAGLNIVGTGYLSATANANGAFLVSILRGIVAISLFAFVLAKCLGMTGIWLAFPVTEAVTLCVNAFVIRKGIRRHDATCLQNQR